MGTIQMIYLPAGILLFLIIYLFSKKGNTKNKNKNKKGDINAHMFPNAPDKIKQWIPYAIEASKLYSIPLEIILGQIWTESGGNAFAVGASGELGLMQLKPIAVKDIEQNGYNSFSSWKKNPKDNIMAGVAFLHLQRKRCRGNINCALRSYNQGYKGAKTNKKLAKEYEDKVLNRANFLGYS